MSGTKVTSDPQSQIPKVEGAGVVTSDSLAAESYNAGGGFSSAPGSQPSKSTNTNNTDISGATILDAAPDAEARQTAEGWNETAQLNAGRQLAQDNTAAAPRSDSHAAQGQFKPKGANLTEGGFDSDAPNASFNQAIGTKKDPARDALGGILKSDAQNAGDAGGPKDSQLSNDGQYDVLKDVEA
ncbi:hypothetical protein K461DRAFT_277126 [Myriangium duriaei CBS 260.36]|uniref:SMP domain-containing protein n=1 Tax=Myriangium duriaei CBS 260.36 TaxID=1168546 RepID=A0A9P4J3F8_9PEZI|nr:hypothetical protein K461DRAFT_277126 [Myriangium duriaei CBS 260.36]